ncbi:MAG: sugar ABC transporter substrate-binding protein [Candidatus Brocadiia bacterium]|nr:MAG: sugar ABC transporter substrate-binding protein [Candidatus Brocadiia bacterium]
MYNKKGVEFMKKVLTGSCVAAIVLVCVFCLSCSSKKEDVPKGKIGMTCMDLTNPFFKLIANLMEQEAAKYGYQVVALSGENDPAKQNNQMTDFTAYGYDAIFLNPVDSKSLGEGVKKAHEAGIPVFTFDVQITDEDAKDLVIAHIGSDNYQGGRLAGESIIKATGDKGRIALITYPEITSCILRVNGFKDFLKEKGSNLEIATELNGKGNRNDGYAVATDILQAYPDIVGVFAINDPSALGAYAAVVKAGKTNQITVVGFDASPAGKQAVYEKKLYDSPQQFPRQMAKGTVEAFIKYLNGEQIEKKIFIPCKHYYYNDSVDDENRVAEQW